MSKGRKSGARRRKARLKTRTPEEAALARQNNTQQMLGLPLIGSVEYARRVLGIEVLDK